MYEYAKPLSPDELNDMLNKLKQGLQQSFGDKLKGLILFGSYARGDFHEESDVDVLVLLDEDNEKLWRHHSMVSQVAEDANGDYWPFLSPTVSSFAEFEEYKNDMFFYKNVLKDGVKLIA